jgi:hypothetical protein
MREICLRHKTDALKKEGNSFFKRKGFKTVIPAKTAVKNESSWIRQQCENTKM